MLREECDKQKLRFALCGGLAMAAMKLPALSQDPGRWEDWGDLRYLLSLEGVDRERVRREFVRRGWEQRFDELLAAL